MGQPAARVGDLHAHIPPFPLIGGPVMPPGQLNVWIGGMPAARVTDLCVCIPAVAPPTPPPTTPIAMGSFGVFIGGMPAARMGDPTACLGIITTGCPTVWIGHIGMGSGPAFANISLLNLQIIIRDMPKTMKPMFKQMLALSNGASNGTPFCEVCNQ